MRAELGAVPCRVVSLCIAFVQVRIRSGRKVLQVRSGVKVVNECAMDVQLEFQDRPAGATAHTTAATSAAAVAAAAATGASHRKRLRVGGEVCIPLHLLANCGSISMRPLVRAFSRSVFGGHACARTQAGGGGLPCAKDVRLTGVVMVYGCPFARPFTFIRCLCFVTARRFCVRCYCRAAPAGPLAVEMLMRFPKCSRW